MNKKEKAEKKNPDEIQENWFSKFFSMKLVLLIHLFVYAAVNGLCFLINLTAWQGRLWAWHVTAGWGIGLAIHLGFYWIFTSGVKSISRTIFITHLIAYATVNINLVTINFVYMALAPGVIWAHIPILIWGYGVLIHFILNSQIEGKGLNAKQIGKLTSNMIFLIDIGYYGIMNALLYYLNLFNIVYGLAFGTLIAWGVAVCAHAVLTVVLNYVEGITAARKGWIVHVTIFALVQLEVYISKAYFPDITGLTLGMLIATCIWGIAVLAHLILVIRWDQTKGDVEDFMKSLFIMHCIAYIAGVALLTVINFMIFEGRLWVPTAALGWLVGLGIHGMLYYLVKSKEKDALKITINLHLTAYLLTMALLTWLNLAIWQGRLWVPTVALGWGIGLGEHLLIYMLKKQNMLNVENGLKASVYLHLTVFALVGSLLVWLNLAFWEGRLWFPIALGGWGIGLGVHILIQYFVDTGKIGKESSK